MAVSDAKIKRRRVVDSLKLLLHKGVQSANLIPLLDPQRPPTWAEVCDAFNYFSFVVFGIAVHRRSPPPPRTAAHLSSSGGFFHAR